jgi:hypothetical protein
MVTLRGGEDTAPLLLGEPGRVAPEERADLSLPRIAFLVASNPFRAGREPKMTVIVW